MYLILCILLGLYILRVTATFLDLRALSPGIPPEFSDQIDDAQYARSQDYTRANARSSLVADTITLGVFLAFWLFGGFTWLDTWSQGLGLSPLLTGLVVIGVLTAAQFVLGIPFELHHTFVIEERFGFNRSTIKTWIFDQLKSLLLLAILGIPLLAGVLWILAEVSHAWLWAWLAVSGFSLAIAFIAPSIILPLFNKFEPLEEGELSRAITDLATKRAFPLSGIFVIDGSRRSSKANAFFVGFGKHRRIALYDTLIERHSVAELLAVLAHEIGHFKKRHIWQQMFLGFLSTGLLFFLLDQFLHTPALYRAFGVEITPAAPPVYFGLIFFLVIYKPVGQIIGIARNALSRRHEFEADAFAAEATGHPEDLTAALRRLSTDSLSNLTPHRLVVWLDHSHPPTVERIRALEKWSQTR